MKVEALANTYLNLLSQVVAKTIADTLTCVEAKAPSKKEGHTVPHVKAYTKRS